MRLFCFPIWRFGRAWFYGRASQQFLPDTAYDSGRKTLFIKHLTAGVQSDRGSFASLVNVCPSVPVKKFIRMLLAQDPLADNVAARERIETYVRYLPLEQTEGQSDL
jgi:hypothetical protein